MRVLAATIALMILCLTCQWIGGKLDELWGAGSFIMGAVYLGVWVGVIHPMIFKRKS